MPTFLLLIIIHCSLKIDSTENTTACQTKKSSFSFSKLFATDTTGKFNLLFKYFWYQFSVSSIIPINLSQNFSFILFHIFEKYHPISKIIILLSVGIFSKYLNNIVSSFISFLFILKIFSSGKNFIRFKSIDLGFGTIISSEKYFCRVFI
jgi:hypothetical protein